ncbi:hypothetical protein Y1Q_0012767 [Alligator mississippiensis]|uniref:Ig-like domain-containing protein n=1 Tax=Alligator mississippiensis TaxID=8496 RepID=A0A151MUJ5_ALLMI|nr:hypothetical protein Y1Q_0012767 [Alligator mississippiensis]
MNALFLFLLLLSTPPCVLSAVQLVESGPGVVKPAETLTLTCTVTGSSITTRDYYWSWIQQSPGKPLQWMGYINYDGRTSYNPSLRSRLIISKDTSKTQFSLWLGSLTAADTAKYYCARGNSGTVTQSRAATVQKGEPVLSNAAELQLRQGSFHLETPHTWGESQTGSALAT